MEEIVKKNTGLDVFSSPQKFNKLMKIGKEFATSFLVPENFKGKPMDCAIAVDMAQRAGLSPMMVMQNLYVVKGRPSWSGQACMALIRACPDFENVKVVYTGQESSDSWGCYITAINKKDKDLVKGPKITIGIAKKEGWYSKIDKYGKETSKWQTMPELMLAYRAAAFFARIYVPNALMGFRVEGEIEDIDTNLTVAVKTVKDPFKKGEENE